MADSIKKNQSAHYLKESLEAARKLLPGWMFAVIHQHALPRSGARARAANRLSPMEKSWVDGIGVTGFSDSELESVSKKLKIERKNRKRKKKSIYKADRQLSLVAKEMQSRGLDVGPDDIQKGFSSGSPDGGMHAHAIDRSTKQTREDGSHTHLFVGPDSLILSTFEDGSHAHAMAGDATENDGTHSHKVLFGDELITTSLGGVHSHQAMVETTGFDGLHKHILTINGDEYESLSPFEFSERFASGATSPELPPASFISDALNELHRTRIELGELHMMMHPELPQVIEMKLASVDSPDTWSSSMSYGEAIYEAKDMLSKGIVPIVKTDSETTIFSSPQVCAEVVSVSETGATVGFLMDGVVTGSDVVKSELPLEEGDIVNVSVGNGDVLVRSFSDQSEPDTVDAVAESADSTGALMDSLELIPFNGPDNANVVFVSASPNEIESARGEAVVGIDGELFDEKYLAPLGIEKSSTALGFVVPRKCSVSDENLSLWQPLLKKEVERFKGAVVVALGQVAKNALGDLCDFVLPHPSAVRRHGDSGEVSRKLKKVKKSIDLKKSYHEDLHNTGSLSKKASVSSADSISGVGFGSQAVRVTKSDEEKQIVYGVVLDPYKIDSDNDRCSPSSIEETAHKFMEESRVIGWEHVAKANAAIVESFIEDYPTQEDYRNAMDNLPHTATRRPYGDDVITSGSWVVGVRLGDEEWKLHKSGKLGGFSIGGSGVRTEFDTQSMPEVEFIDLKPPDSV